MRVLVAPSLLAADFSRLKAEVDDVQQAGADMIHLDLMDGHFVPNLSFGPGLVRDLAPHCRVPLDAHLMVTNADPLIPELAAAGVARVAVHVEACTHLHRTLALIRGHGMVPGVALNPATAPAMLEGVVQWADFILVMSVNPGFGGQSFIPEAVETIRRVRRLVAAREMEIAVDGGVSLANAADLGRAGARILIAGTTVFKAPDRARAIADLRRLATEGALP